MPGSFCFDLCCGAGGVCNTILYARECGASQNGVVITVAGVGTMTTNNAISGGQVLFSIPSAGTYTVSATIAGVPCSADLSLLCDGGAPNTGLDVWWIEVQGCTGPLEGAIVSVAGFADQTTDASGKVYYCLPFVLNLTGPYAISVAHDRFVTYSDTWDGASCPTIILTAADGYVCSSGDCGRNLPIPATTNGNDSVLGAVPMTYDGLAGQWIGTLTVDIAACGSCPAATGVTVTYFWPRDVSDCSVGVLVTVSAGCPAASGGTANIVPTGNTFTPDPLDVETTYAQCNCGGGGVGCLGRQIWPGTGTTTVSMTE